MGIVPGNCPSSSFLPAMPFQKPFSFFCSFLLLAFSLAPSIALANEEIQEASPLSISAETSSPNSEGEQPASSEASSDTASSSEETTLDQSAEDQPSTEEDSLETPSEEGLTSENLLEVTPPSHPNFVPSSPISAAAFLDSVRGNYDTDLFTGSATFSYPFVLPSDRNGSAPPLVLSYSSNTDHHFSSTGIGWELSGGSIFRSTPKGVDRLYSENTFTANIFGQWEELILVDAANGIYAPRTEGSFTEYQFQNNTWTARDAKGTQYIFGAQTPTRQDDPSDSSRIYKWMLERTEDIHGNVTTFSYTKDAGQIYPDKIQYAFENGTPLSEIVFSWEAKPHIPISYTTGFSVKTTKRLAMIQIFSSVSGTSKSVRKYSFSYEDTGTITDLLSSIVVSNTTESGTEALPPTSFEYFDGTEGIFGQKLHLLKKITFPLGGSTELRYKPSTAYRTAAQGIANTNLPFVIHTIYEVRSQALPNAPTYTTTYTYEGGHYYFDEADAFTREYAGFYRVTMTDPLGNVSQMFFHQSEFAHENSESTLKGEFEDHISKKGKIYRTEHFDASGNLFSIDITKWNKTHLLDVDPEYDRFFVFAERKVTGQFDGATKNPANINDARWTAIEDDYDDFGNITEERDFGEVSLTNEKGDFTDIGNDRMTTDTEYANNTSLRLLRFPQHLTQHDQQNALLGEQKIFYDNLSLGQIQKGDVTKTETRISTETSEVAVTQASYNTFGQMTSFTNPRGFVTSVAYDPHSLFPVTITNAKQQQTNVSYHPIFGTPEQITDPNGSKKKYLYDPLGRLVEVQVSDPNTPSALVAATKNEYHYSQTPALETATALTGTGIEVKTNTFFDGFNRPIQTRTTAANNQVIVVSSEYDALGRLSKQTLPIFETGFSYSTPAPSALGTTTVYDGLGRPVSVSTPAGTTLNYYDRWKQIVVDPNGEWKEFYFDARQNLIKVVEWADEGTIVQGVPSKAPQNASSSSDLEVVSTLSPLENEAIQPHQDEKEKKRITQEKQKKKMQFAQKFLTKKNISSRDQKRFFQRLETFENLKETKKNSKGLQSLFQKGQNDKKKEKHSLQSLQKASSDSAKQQLKEDIRNARQEQKQNLREINVLLQQENDTLVSQAFASDSALLKIAQESDLLEPNFLFALQETPPTPPYQGGEPNDPLFSQQWGLPSIIGKGTQNLVYSSENPKIVAIIDTGVDTTHEDITGQMWTSDSCVDENGDPVLGGCKKGGYDFVDHDSDPFPDDNQYHGTAVAGVIGAATNNGTGIASISGIGAENLQPVQIMSLRACCTTEGYFQSGAIASAIRFAANNGAQVVNMSFGGPTFSQSIHDAIAEAEKKGVLVVAAAGNYGSNNDTDPLYPASYDLPNILSVAAIDPTDSLASFSNFGSQSVDLAAPGVNILTTTPGNAYTALSGTSFSAPFVSAMTGLFSGDYHAREASLWDTATQPLSSLSGLVVGGKVLRLASVITEEPTTPATETPKHQKSGKEKGGKGHEKAPKEKKQKKSLDTPTPPVSSETITALSIPTPPAGRAPFSTTYEYDTNNNLITLADAQGNAKEMTYDLLGRMLTETMLHRSDNSSPNMWTYTYDHNGNPLTKHTPKGDTLTYTHEELDRILSETDGTQTTTYAYDTASHGIGKLASVTSPAVTKSYGYDILGRVISETKTIESTPYITTTTFDLLGNPLTITTPNSITTSYAYNNAAQPISVTSGGNALVTNISYIANGSPAVVAYGNGITTTNTYNINQDYRLTHKQTGTAQNPSALQDIVYTFDPVGNITQITDTSSTSLARTTTYEYDALHRLMTVNITTSQGTTTEEYSYDIVGNLLSKAGVNYNYQGVHPHAVSSAGGQNFSYDHNGNMTTSGDWVYGWDNKDRMISSTLGATESLLYSYDESNIRVLKQNNTTGKKTTYISTLFEKEGDITRTFFYVGDLKIASQEDTGNESKRTFHHSDHLSGASVDTDSQGAIAQISDYFPYGESRIEEQENGYNNDSLFTGKELDDESQLYYYEARYYDPLVGRFISVDPWKGDIRDPQSLNKYSYVRNNPVKYVDPSGKVYIPEHFKEVVNNSPLGKLNDTPAELKQKEEFNEKYGDTIKTGIVLGAGALVGGLGSAVEGTNIVVGVIDGIAASDIISDGVGIVSDLMTEGITHETTGEAFGVVADAAIKVEKINGLNEAMTKTVDFLLGETTQAIVQTGTTSTLDAISDSQKKQQTSQNTCTNCCSSSDDDDDSDDE